MPTNDKTKEQRYKYGKEFERIGEFIDDFSGGRLRMQLTRERFAEIWKDIVTGSEPAPRYYIMVVVSTLIAGFGLVANSTAVVIGAMLVAPLMTPIFGISLALVRGNTPLFRKALKAEVIGVFVAIAMGFLVGGLLILVDPSIESTTEMLVRTKPNLFDLIVALLAGFAGAYAIIDKHISPALPGVAIATAIVPPLANCGLSLAYGNYSGALGSFLLFTANFLSIHLISAVLFLRVGMGRDYGEETRGVLVRRFGLTFVFFIGITITFGYFLYEIMHQRGVRNTIHTILSEELSDYAATGIDDLVISNEKDKTHILARIYSTGEFNPNQINLIEERLNKNLEIPANLVVRAIKTSDVSAKGADILGSSNNPEGFFFDETIPARINLLRMAEQTAREYLANFIGMDFVKVEYIKLPQKPSVQVVISGLRAPTVAEIDELENEIRIKTRVPHLKVMVRFINEELLTADGPVRHAWITFIDVTEAQKTTNEQGKKIIAEAFESKETLLLTQINGLIEESGHVYLAELEGTGDYKKSELITLQNRLRMTLKEPVSLYVWLNHGVVLTDKGLVAYSALLKKRLANFHEESRESIQEMLKNAR